MLAINDCLICDSCLVWIHAEISVEAQRKQLLTISTHLSAFLGVQVFRLQQGDDPAIIENNLTCLNYFLLQDANALWTP